MMLETHDDAGDIIDISINTASDIIELMLDEMA